MEQILLEFIVISAFSISTTSGTFAMDFDRDASGRSKWPTPVIPYKIDNTSILANETAVILAAMQELSSQTCLRFHPVNNETYYITFVRAPSYYGKMCKGGLGRSSWNNVFGFWRCFSKPAYVMHEMMHILGFLHEHERWDRDQYVRILWENIPARAVPMFYKRSRREPVTTMNSGYDAYSIMHYEPRLYNAARTQIIAAVDPHKIVESRIGQKERLSYGDVKAINEMYCRPTTLAPHNPPVTPPQTERSYKVHLTDEIPDLGKRT